jgi:hypothetical protein
MAEERVTADELMTMTREITLGVPPRNSSLEMTAARRQAWDRLRIQINEIKAKGGIVEICE